MIADDRLVLRPWKEADLGLLTALRNDIALQHQLLSRPRGSQEADVRAWATARSSNAEQLFFVVAGKDDDAGLGYLQFSGINPVDRKAELGICLAPGVQQKGFGRATIQLAAGHLNRTWAIRKIHLRVLASNEAAIRCYRSCGFEQCGLHRADVFLDGAFRDVMLMELFLPEGS